MVKEQAPSAGSFSILCVSRFVKNRLKNPRLAPRVERENYPEMYKIFSFFLLWLFGTTGALAQRPLSGIINAYSAVSAVDTCRGLFVLDNPAPFQAGDVILIVQMQGAAIDESNSSSFGEILDYGSAGLYERAVVASLQGDSLFVQEHLLYDYQAGAGLQVVSLPQYGSAVVVDTLRAQAWNGQTGGVLALEVSDTLYLQAPVVLDGQGFRGGQLLPEASSCQWFLQQNDWYYALGDWRGAAKGEGIATYLMAKEAGRGPQANGGGGGNDHNSGGGGGGQAGSQGGIGGNYYFESVFGCPGVYSGRGGRALQVNPLRIFMGGGGGSGHANDGGAGSAGGAGGGIAFIRASVLVANNQHLSASGLSANTAQGDGGGGGGAGGSIALLADEILGSLSLNLSGGAGGGSISEPERCYGPGGGGSGGHFLCNLSGLGPDLSGGPAGENGGNLSQCEGASNGAQNGQSGQYSTWSGFPQGPQTFVYPSLTDTLPDTLWACVGENLSLSVSAGGDNISLQWQVDEGGGFVDIPPNAPDYSGQQTAELTISVQPFMQAYRYRCRVSHPCLASLFSSESTLALQQPPTASFTYVQDLSSYVAEFSAQISNADSLWWDFGDGTGNGTEVSPIHQYDSGGTYTVGLTVFNSCGSFTYQAELFFGQPPLAAFSVDLPSGCAPHTVQFEDLSQGTDNNRQWYFPGGNPSSSTAAQPIVFYPEPGLYDVKLVVQNALGQDSLLQEDYIQVVAFPSAAFTWQANGLEVAFQDASTGDITQYQWNFGDGSPISFEQNPVHLYPSYGSYEVILTVSNLHCGSVLTDYILLQATGTRGPLVHKRWAVFPNPTKEEVVLEWSSPQAGNLSWTLFDALGRRRAGRTERVREGEQRYVLSFPDLPEGIYYLHFSMGAHRQVVRLHLLGF